MPVRPNDVLGLLVVVVLALAFSVGIVLFFICDNGWWLLLSVISLIVTMAG